MIEWLMQVVGVAWLGAMVVMMAKACEAAGPPDDGRTRRGRATALPFRGSTDSRRSLRPTPRAQRGNARELRTAPDYGRRSPSSRRR